MSEGTTSSSAVIEQAVKKNKPAIRMGIALGLVFAGFSIINSIIPFIVCLTIFFIWALKFFAGIVLADAKSMNKDNLFKSDALTAMGAYSVVSAVIEGVIGGIFGVLWALIVSQSAFALGASIFTALITFIGLLIGNFIFTLLGALVYAYLDKSTLSPIAGLIKGTRNLLKI